jgi:hypothetical protein
MNEVLPATVALRTPAIRATHETRWATGRDRRSHPGGLAQRRPDPGKSAITQAHREPMEHVTVGVDALLPRARTTYHYDGC